MSKPEPDTAEVRARITQFLFTVGVALSDEQKGVVLQFGHLGEIESPIVLTPWDARRLVAEVIAVLGSIDPENPKVAKLVETVWALTDPTRPEWHESGDPGVGPWPPKPPSPKRRKKKP